MRVNASSQSAAAAAAKQDSKYTLVQSEASQSAANSIMVMSNQENNSPRRNQSNQSRSQSKNRKIKSQVPKQKPVVNRQDIKIEDQMKKMWTEKIKHGDQVQVMEENKIEVHKNSSREISSIVGNDLVKDKISNQKEDNSKQKATP